LHALPINFVTVLYGDSANPAAPLIRGSGGLLMTFLWMYIYRTRQISPLLVFDRKLENWFSEYLCLDSHTSQSNAKHRETQETIVIIY